MVGQRLGNYLIKREIGHGGMGVVYEASHEQIGRRAAIKVLRAAYATDGELGARFLNEARAVNIIDHPGVVSAFDFGHTPDGVAYIVMDFLAGSTLRQRLEQLSQLGGRLGRPKALRLSRQLASALAAAHAKKIIHRDLKPENVMLVPDPERSGDERAKILDFGLAKVALEHEGRAGAAVQTQQNLSMGTPAYMAPEQWQAAGSVTDKADVYSLGVLMFELLAGAPPFQASQPRQLMKLHLLDPPPLLGEVDAATPQALSELVGAMLAKQPEARPRMSEVLAALEQLDAVSAPPGPAPALQAAGATETGHNLRAALPSLPSPSLPPPSLPPPSLPAASPAPQSRRLGGVGLLLGLGIGLGAGLGMGALLWHRHPQVQGPAPLATLPPARPTPAPVERAAPWEKVDSGTTENLYAIWGADPKDIWAVGGGGQVVHFDGLGWQRVTIPSKTPQVDSLRAIWGSGHKDVWVAGKAGVLMHYDGTRWSEVPSGTDQNLYCIWGLSATDWWTGGRQGVLLNWDGKELLPVDLPTKQQVRGIWASSPSDLWAVATSDANEGTILHYDGRAWTSHTEPARVSQIWGSRPDDVWVVGGKLGNQGVVLHYNGKVWAPAEVGESQWLSDLWGSGPDDVWLAGESNTLLHWNGRLWTRSECATSESLRGLWGASASDIWAVGTRGALCHFSGREWSSAPSGVRQNLSAVWQPELGGDEAWAVGSAGLILQRRGGSWSPVKSGVTTALYAITGNNSGAREVWAVGDQGTVLRGDGQSFQVVPSGTQFALHAVWLARPGEPWVAGEKGALLRWDGQAFRPVATPGRQPADLSALFGFAGGDLWAAGSDGTILHWDGAAMRLVPSGIKARLRGIYGARPTEMWAVGDAGTLLRGGPTGFSAVPALTPEPLHAISGSGPRDIWAVGGGGVILHSAGTSFAKVISGTTMSLYGLSEDARGQLWAVGQWGTTLHY